MKLKKKILDIFFSKKSFFSPKNGDGIMETAATLLTRRTVHRVQEITECIKTSKLWTNILSVKKILPFEIKEIVCYGLGPVDKLGSINQTWSHPILGDLAQTRNSIYQLSLLVLKPVLLLYYVCILVFSGRRTDVSKSRFTSNEEYCTSVHTCTFCEHNGVA